MSSRLIDRIALDGAGRPLAAAGLVLGLAAAGMAVWVSQAPVSGAVIAEGSVAVEGDTKVVQHLDGGVIDQLLVAEGDVVEADQALVRLDATDALAERAALAAERASLVARAARLRAELDGAAEPVFSALTEDTTGAAAMGEAVVEAAIASQQALFIARRAERDAEAAMLADTLARYDARARALDAEIESVERQAALLEEDVAAIQSLAARGGASKLEMRARQRDIAKLRGAAASLHAQGVEAQAARSEARAKHAEAMTELTSAISEELARVVGRLSEISPQLSAIEARLSRAVIRAPISGVVNNMDLATIGGVVAPGEKIMDIVPLNGTLVVKARVSPRDRERVFAGMAAQVRLNGVTRREDPNLQATVRRVSADLSSDRRSGADAEDDDHYEISVALLETPSDVALAPGMPATAVMATGARSVLDYVLTPYRDALARSLREE
jgi:HlyD family type I secretion membrane fusion protein